MSTGSQLRPAAQPPSRPAARLSSQVDFPKRARERLLEFARDGPCSLVLLGHCGTRGTRCTHAYVATPSAASALLQYYHGMRGCVQPDDPTEAYCERADVCCSIAKGTPGKALYGARPDTLRG